MLQFGDALLETNLVIAAFNLIPFKPFDGHMAWKLPGMWLDKKKRGQAPKPPSWGKAQTNKRAERRAEPKDQVEAEERARRIAKEALDRARGGN